MRLKFNQNILKSPTIITLGKLLTAIQFNNSYAALPDVFYTRQSAAPAPNPAWIAANTDLANELGIDPGFLTSDAGLAMVSGQKLPHGADPLAMAYAGHQFGGWSARLGDGRALLLGEVAGFDLQLKGSGRTPYSRGGDGKSAVGPVIREYILSEAMHTLGVPTTRALAAVTTGEPVYRETALPGAILTRVALSHIRVGTFQYFYANNDHKALQALADYTIDRLYPEAGRAENPVQALFAAIIKRQAKLIALWMKFGFIHGVMNTDNCHIAGQTIDYGPCAFMENFEPMKVFSSIDAQGRYAWGRQPHMAHWNLMRLGEALSPIWGGDENAVAKQIEATLADFSEGFNQCFQTEFAHKLGLNSTNPILLENTLQIMAEHKIDFTLFFSYLRRLEQNDIRDSFLALFNGKEAAESWLTQWQKARDESGISASESQVLMNAANPIYIARNHRVEQAIVAGTSGDYTLMHRLIEVLKNPFEQQENADEYEAAAKPEEAVQQTFCGT
ncbi:MAG: YdiU family protein [Amylibacter sp.]|nr:YdiU family protein [Amylibacter sp.]